MTGMKKLLSLALVACAAVLPAWAEDAPAPAETPVAAPAPAPDAATDAKLIADEQSAPSNQNVWWGNRSIGFGNYIKFDKSTAVAGGCDWRKKCVMGCEQPCGNCPCCRPITFDKIFFDLDKSVLRPAGREECDKVVAYMNANPDITVDIEGHCCDLAPDAYNIGLGQRRANSVKKYLVEHGIDAARVNTETFGERRPWQPVEHRELNRRAIVVVIPAEEGGHAHGK